MKKYFILKTLLLTLILLPFISLLSKHPVSLAASPAKFKKGSVAVFYAQHQDDEILWAGSTILDAIHTLGRDNVYLVLVSNGTGNKFFGQDPSLQNLSKTEKMEIRNREFLSSAQALGFKDSNVILVPLLDKNHNTNFQIEKSLALKFEKKFSRVIHISHSYTLDDHPQHRKCGQVIMNLYENGEIKEAMFFVKPKFQWRIPQDKKVIFSIDTEEDRLRIQNSCQAYMDYDPTSGKEAIGYRTNKHDFDKLLSDPNAKAYLHLPL